MNRKRKLLRLFLGGVNHFGVLALLLVGGALGPTTVKAQPFAYVTNFSSNTVSVIATASNTVVATVGVGSGPVGVAITPDGAFAYVTNAFSNTVSVIATASNTVVATVGVGSSPGSQPVDVAITPDGAFAYVTNFDVNTVSVIATASNTVVATVGVGSRPQMVAITPDGAFAYVTNFDGNTVSVIATASNTVVATVGVGLRPFGVAITPDGAFAYVANNVGLGGTVSVIATASNTVVATVGVGSSPVGVAITPDGAFAYVANDLSNTVSVIATASNTVVATVGVGLRPFRVAVALDQVLSTFIVIDEDSIDNGTESIQDISFNAPFCGGLGAGVGDPGVCVNDDIADPAVRTPLFSRPLENPVPGGTTLVLPTGRVGDEALFRFGNPDPQVSLLGTPPFSIQEFITATGAAADEDNLDKIDGVVPLGAVDIADLEGKTVCAVVYDNDLSADVKDGYTSLKGATLGLTAFTVTAVEPDPGGSVLPSITVDLLPSADVQTVCESVQ